MRVLAGFNPDNPNFYISRAAVSPPQVLTSQIFPSTDAQLAQNAQSACPNLAASGFLKFIVHFRSVLLLDAVELEKLFPDHFIWKHPIFQSQFYRAN